MIIFPSESPGPTPCLIHTEIPKVLKTFCFALTFNGDDSLFAVGIMQGIQQTCSVSFYAPNEDWRLVKKIERCNAVEFFPLGGKCKVAPAILVQASAPTGSGGEEGR
jgi:hypothetical protein